MSPDNQYAYWDKVASQKTFTHPLDPDIIDQWFSPDLQILDYGCGYGRLCRELYDIGYPKITGVDTSARLIARGMEASPMLDLRHISGPESLPQMFSDLDAVLLFAVLTCIPSNAGQQALIDTLYDTLRPGGRLYISDYYLQDDQSEVGRYGYYQDDPNNYGVFSLPEGATFRHHTPEWIAKLLKTFTLIAEKEIMVRTMNGHAAKAFQMVLTKG